LRSINTDHFSEGLRRKSIDLSKRKILISQLRSSDQEKDLQTPVNCGGYGRIRHFTKNTAGGWPPNPLPIEPAARALKTYQTDQITAQVFQNAACNWRCWYCYVPFSLLSADEKRSAWLSASELIDLYLGESEKPPMIDLSGGQPDLVPEWVPWIMAELKSRNLQNEVYLWSDDNLSNDYFWRYLSKEDLDLVTGYANYAKVCCFKGFDSESFAFNTGAAPTEFGKQFTLMQRYVELGLDVYGYVTLTCEHENAIEARMGRFIDQLQLIDTLLPLRIVPLQIKVFTPVAKRVDAAREKSLLNQEVAVAAWQAEIAQRFSTEQRNCCIVDIPLGGFKK
jgi:uncharacterized Fe-S cluster-containing radical SAM superfamily protein